MMIGLIMLIMFPPQSTGVWLVINRAKFDLYHLDEPHHSIVLLSNVSTGEFVLRILGVTRERGYVSSWDEFQSLCINRFVAVADIVFLVHVLLVVKDKTLFLNV